MGQVARAIDADHSRSDRPAASCREARDPTSTCWQRRVEGWHEGRGRPRGTNARDVDGRLTEGAKQFLLVSRPRGWRPDHPISCSERPLHPGRSSFSICAQASGAVRGGNDRGSRLSGCCRFAREVILTPSSLARPRNRSSQLQTILGRFARWSHRRLRSIPPLFQDGRGELIGCRPGPAPERVPSRDPRRSREHREKCLPSATVRTVRKSGPTEPLPGRPCR